MNVRAVEEMCCCVFCGFAEWTWSGHGNVVLVGSILCLNCCKNGDLLVHSCANVLLVFLGSVCSSFLMSGAIWLMILLGVLLLM